MSEPMDKREEVELPKLVRKPLGSCNCNDCDENYWPDVAKERESQLKSSLAANREQKAEIERLSMVLRGYEAVTAGTDGYVALPTLPTEKEK